MHPGLLPIPPPELLTRARTEDLVQAIRESPAVIALQEHLETLPAIRLRRRGGRITGWARSFALRIDAIPDLAGHAGVQRALAIERAQALRSGTGWYGRSSVELPHLHARDESAANFLVKYQGLAVNITAPIERYGKPVLSSRGTPYQFCAGYFRSQPHLTGDLEEWATPTCSRSIGRLEEAWGWTPETVHLASNTHLHRSLRGRGIGRTVYNLLLRFANHQGAPLTWHHCSSWGDTSRRARRLWAALRNQHDHLRELVWSEQWLVQTASDPAPREGNRVTQEGGMADIPACRKRPQGGVGARPARERYHR